MTRIAGVVVVALLLSQSAAAQLNKLIEQNITSQTYSANRLTNEPQKNTPQLWIHVRSEDQKRVVQGKLDWFRGLEVGGRKVEVRPIQMVSEGPKQSQLRFFRQTDQSQAEALLAEIRKAVPLTVLQDMSRQYQQVQWIEPGHYELWLAPNVATIAPAQ